LILRRIEGFAGKSLRSGLGKTALALKNLFCNDYASIKQSGGRFNLEKS
jgi:hypothetical protein